MPETPEQPPIGGFCATCGHLAARHSPDGCTGVMRGCDCLVMRWLDTDWPRPWLPAPRGLRCCDQPPEQHPEGCEYETA